MILSRIRFANCTLVSSFKHIVHEGKATENSCKHFSLLRRCAPRFVSGLRWTEYEEPMRTRMPMYVVKPYLFLTRFTAGRRDHYSSQRHSPSCRGRFAMVDTQFLTTSGSPCRLRHRTRASRLHAPMETSHYTPKLLSWQSKLGHLEHDGRRVV